ncbi:MAG: hypothetical protein LUC24_04460, partial [Bacteroidales bacterium]|nr:hypothetical protein [Bacteroidales bacterium]
MKRSYLFKSIKRGLLCKPTLLFVALFSMSMGTYAVDESDIVEIQSGETYTFKGFTDCYYSYTATESGSLVLAGLAVDANYPIVYKDAAFTEEWSGVASNDGYVDGGQQVTITVTAGETYYLKFHSMESSPSFTATFMGTDESPTITYCSPEEGSELSVVSDIPVTLKFSVTVTVGTATLTSGSQSVTLTQNYTNGFYSWPVWEILYTWLSEGLVNPGDEVTFTLKDVKNSYDTPFGEDGTVTIVYKMPESVTELTDVSMPEVFIPWWQEGDENGIMTLTFSNDISTEEDLAPNVELWYGEAEAEVDRYTETITPTVDGSTVTIDFTGVSRLRRDMISGTATDYTTIIVRVKNLHDVNGYSVYTTGQGTVGSLTYEIPYTEFTIFPCDTTIESLSEVIIDYPSGIQLEDPSKVVVQDYKEQDFAYGTDVQAYTEEGSDIPTKLIVTLDKTITDDGTYYIKIAKGSLTVNYPDYITYDYNITEMFSVEASAGIGSVSLQSANNANGKIYT